jgi:hypothetical protein
MGNGIRVCRVFGEDPAVYIVIPGEKGVESLNTLEDAALLATEFTKTMSALKGGSQR